MNYRSARLVLGTHSASTYTDIKQAFRKKAKLVHPDQNQSDHAKQSFSRLVSAYRLLMAHRSPYQVQRYRQNRYRRKSVALMVRQAALALVICVPALAQTQPRMAVSWDLIPTAFAFKYRVQTTVGSLPFITAAECTLPPCIVTKIEGSTIYKIRVAGVEEDGREGTYSNPISFAFASVQPLAPTSLTQIAVTSSEPGKVAKKLSWTAVTKFRNGTLIPPGVVKYLVYQAGTSSTVLIAETTSPSLLVLIEKGKSYQFYVTAVVDNIESFTSPAVRVWTPT